MRWLTRLPVLLTCWSLVLAAVAAERQATANDKKPPRRLALLVGIGKYYQNGAAPGKKPWSVLHTQREVEEYRRVLLSPSYGFAEPDVLVLTDDQATKTAIRQAFERHLIAQARPGDVVLFHFSGHGQQVPDAEGPAQRDEPDGLDESLVTYDALDSSIPEGRVKNILDDELGRWLQELAARMRPAPGAAVEGNITVTLDTCYSGTATRGALIPRGRTWDPATDGPLPLPRRDLPAEGGAAILSQPSGASTDFVVVSAARADQTAWERSGQGVFTRHWVRLLAQSRAEDLPTYQAAVDRLAIELATEGLDQTPQVEGAVTQALFSGRVVPNGRGKDTMRAQLAEDGSLWLSVGEVHGVTPRSVYRLYAVASTLDAGALLGKADVVEVTPFAARLRPRPGVQLGSRPGCLAVEVEHAYALSPLRVMLSGETGRMPLRGALEALDVVRLMEPRAEAADQDYDLLLRYELQPPARLALLRPGFDRPFAEVDIPDGDPTQLVQQLRAEWRRVHFAALRHDASDARVELEIVPAASSSPEPMSHPEDLMFLPKPLPASHQRLPRGQWMGLRLHNRSARDLYVSVLAISADGDIDVLYGGSAGNNRLRAGATLTPPLRAVGCQLVGKTGELVVFKVIATDTFVDFSGVEYAGRPATTRGPKPAVLRAETLAPLQQLLEEIAGGKRGSAGLLQPAHWGTTDASVVIQ